MESKLTAAFAVFCALFIAGDLPFLKSVAASDDMFFIATSGTRTHFYATVFDSPMTKNEAGRFCTSRGMALPSMTVKGPNRLLHQNLKTVMQEATGAAIEPRFWAAGYQAGNHCRYAFQTKYWLGLTWTDCSREEMRLGVCVKTGVRN